MRKIAVFLYECLLFAIFIYIIDIFLCANLKLWTWSDNMKLISGGIYIAIIILGCTIDLVNKYKKRGK